MLQKIIFIFILVVATIFKIHAQDALTLNVLKANHVKLENGVNIKINASDNGMTKSLTQSFVENNTITINENGATDVVVTLPLDKLGLVNNKNNAFILSSTSLNNSNVNIVQEGGGFVDLAVSTNNLSIINNNGGTVRINGQANKTKIITKNNSMVDISQLTSFDLDINTDNPYSVKQKDIESFVNEKPIKGKNNKKNKEEVVVISKKIMDNNVDADSTDTVIVLDPETGKSDTVQVLLGKKKIIIADNERKIRSNEYDDEIIIDTVNYKEKKKKKVEKPDVDWAGLEFGIYNWSNKDLKFIDTVHQHKSMLKSTTLNANFWEKKFGNATTRVILGAGINFNYFRFEQPYKPENRGDRFVFTSDTVLNKSKKTKLVTTSITIPVMFQFNTSKKQKTALRLSFGIINNIRIANALKEKIAGDRSEKKVTRNDFGMNKYRMDATVRLGYKDFYVFANYALKSQFKNSIDGDVRPFTIGISLLGL